MHLLFQYLSKKLGADPTTFGQLQTVFAVTQLLGGPVFGRIGDTLGEKFALILAFSGATLSYLLMGLANSLPMLFLSRLPSVVMHTMQGIYKQKSHKSFHFTKFFSDRFTNDSHIFVGRVRQS